MDVIPTIFNSFDFYGDNISYTFNPEDQKYYLDINTIFAGIGLEGRQIDYHRGKWLLDKTISRGIKEFSEAGQPVKYCIAIDRLPYGLASLNPKSHMISRTDDVVSKIEKYQDELGDFAANVCYSESSIENEPVRNTVVINQEYSPLSREEFAAFMLYEENRAKTLEGIITGFIANQTSVLSEQSTLIKTLLSKIVIPANTDIPAESASYEEKNMCSTKDESSHVISAEHWTRTILEKIQNYCKYHGRTNGNYMLRKIYAEMKSRGTDLNSLKLEYTKTNNLNLKTIRKIDIVADNIELRALFIACMNDIFAENVKKAKPSNSGYCNYIPDAIHEKMTPLVFEGENSHSALLRVYREMEKHLPYQLKQYVSEFKKENDIKYVSTAYVIANTPELLNLFDEAVKSFL